MCFRLFARCFLPSGTTTYAYTCLHSTQSSFYLLQILHVLNQIIIRHNFCMYSIKLPSITTTVCSYHPPQLQYMYSIKLPSITTAVCSYHPSHMMFLKSPVWISNTGQLANSQNGSKIAAFRDRFFVSY